VIFRLWKAKAKAWKCKEKYCTKAKIMICNKTMEQASSLLTLEIKYFTINADLKT
jgi:hypothetical protein